MIQFPYKECERKFLFNGDWETAPIFHSDRFDIEDYYISENYRIRRKDRTWYSTFKSDGTIQRDEYEFKIDKPINLPDIKPLRKTRYIVPHYDLDLEVNIFKDIIFQGKPLTIIEVELVDPNQPVHFPSWVGVEVTYDKRFYGYNLSKLLDFSNFSIINKGDF